jgi:DNA polymerase III subunit epsilon
MGNDDIYKTLETAQRLGLIAINSEAVARLALTGDVFLTTFAAYRREGDPLLRAVALLVELDGTKTEAQRLREQYPDYRVHMITQVECYTSSSGNTTWKAYDEDGEIIYLRQKDREILEGAALWDQLNQMSIGQECEAEIELHTVQDGDFRRVVQIDRGGIVRLIAPEPEMPGRQIDVIQWADTLLSEGNFVVLDTETTSLEGYPIQIAVLSPDGEVLFDRLIKPPSGVGIDPGAEAVHGIGMDKLSNAPEFGELFDELNEILKGKTVVAYNAAFDRSMLSAAQIYYGCLLDDRRWTCAMEQYARYVGDDRGDGEYRWHKLAVAARELGVRWEDAHSALGDCRMTLGIIKALAKKAKTEKPTDGDIPF